MNFFTFISHVVSLQSKQPLFFPGVYKNYHIFKQDLFYYCKGPENKINILSI